MKKVSSRIYSPHPILQYGAIPSNILYLGMGIQLSAFDKNTKAFHDNNNT